MSRNFALMLAGAFLMTVTGFESASALNPQPLPPFVMPHGSVYTTTHTSGRYLPPGPCRASACGANHFQYSNGLHRLNPQPLPPG